MRQTGGALRVAGTPIRRTDGVTPAPPAISCACSRGAGERVVAAGHDPGGGGSLLLCPAAWDSRILGTIGAASGTGIGLAGAGVFEGFLGPRNASGSGRAIFL